MNFTYRRGSCNFKQPIQVGSESLVKREWIEVSNGEIKVDLAPLPGLHSETLEESLEDFTTAKYNTPSALFAKECFEIFTSVQDVDVVSNKLIYIDLNSSVKEVASKIESNQVYKIKIGRNNHKEESQWLLELMKSTPENTLFRLDGNQSFALSELNNYLRDLDLTKVQYIEEPLTNVNEWQKLDRIDEIDLALDENIGLRRELDFATYIVSKPTWNLSLKDTLKELAVENQEVIISSAFEPPNNLKLLKMIATESEQVAGLDTLSYFYLDSLNFTPLKLS